MAIAAPFIVAACDAPAECACGDDEACVRGVCVADCGAGGETLESALGEGLIPVAGFCRSAAAYAVSFDGNAATVWEVTSTTAGTETTFVLSRWALDPEGGSSPSANEVATAVHDTGDAAITTFPGGFLALDPSGERAAFGYTTSGEGFPGTVVVADVATGALTELSAPANFDAAWTGAEHLTVNGQGLGELAEGQGLYTVDLASDGRVVHLATGLGTYSGAVVTTEAFVLAAGVEDGTFEPHAYAIPRELYETALEEGTPVDVANEETVVEVLDPSGAALPSTFAIVADRLVAMPFGGPITSYALDGAALSDARVIATGETFTNVLPAGEGRLLLVHAAGLLLVEE